jgi:hypothetical protein
VREKSHADDEERASANRILDRDVFFESSLLSLHSFLLFLQKKSSFDVEPDTTARTVVTVCLGLVGILMIGNVALWYLAQKSSAADGAGSKNAAARKKVSKKKLKRETLRRGLPMPE